MAAAKSKSRRSPGQNPNRNPKRNPLQSTLRLPPLVESELTPAQQTAAGVDALNPAWRRPLAGRAVRLLHARSRDRRADPATRGVLPVQDAAAEATVGIRHPRHWPDCGSRNTNSMSMPAKEKPPASSRKRSAISKPEGRRKRRRVTSAHCTISSPNCTRSGGCRTATMRACRNCFGDGGMVELLAIMGSYTLDLHGAQHIPRAPARRRDTAVRRAEGVDALSAVIPKAGPDKKKLDRLPRNDA